MTIVPAEYLTQRYFDFLKKYSRGIIKFRNLTINKHERVIVVVVSK